MDGRAPTCTAASSDGQERQQHLVCPDAPTPSALQVAHDGCYCRKNEAEALPPESPPRFSLVL